MDTEHRDSTQRSRRRGRLRRLALGTIVAVAATTMSAAVLASPAAAYDQASADTVEQALAANSTAATTGYYLREIDGPVHANLNEAVQWEPASAIKALIFAHAMRQVDDGVVTLATQIPNQWTLPAGSCPAPTGSGPASLSFALSQMMIQSDNRWTQALRDFFTDAAIDQTRQDLGMNSSVLSHLIGCYSSAAPAGFTRGLDDPNALTLEDAGVLWEQMATGYLADWGAAQGFMTQSNAALDAIIDSEAGATGVSAQGISDVKALRDSANKIGNYDGGGFSVRTVAGWAQLPFKNAFCDTELSGFVYGAFIDRSTSATPAGFSIAATATELFRERIRAALQTWATCESDLEHLSIEFVDPPAEIAVNTPTELTIRHVLTSNGPAALTDSIVSTDVIAPADCEVEPTHAEQSRTLTEGDEAVVETDFTVTCSAPSFHDIDVTGSVVPALAGHSDPDATNDTSEASAQVGVIAHADLSVVGIDTSEIDDAQLGDLLVGATFDFEASATIHNAGDTALGVYDDPVDTVVTRRITVPAGVAASVTVTADEAPAVVQITPDGQAPIIHPGQPAGAHHAVSGPAVIDVFWSNQDDVAVDEDRLVAATYDLACEQPGSHDIGLRVRVAPLDQHVLDPTPANDVVEVDRTIECVTPVAINIRPGNAKNQVKVGSNQSVPAAVLTTEAGEYGLPLAFDATTIDHTSVLFGVPATLAAGGGSQGFPDHQFIRDSFELDDSTKDGDDDATFKAPVPGTGIALDSTEACLTGAYAGEGGETFTFLGCDVIDPN